MTDIAYLIPGVGLDKDEKNRREQIANEMTTGNVTVVDVDEGPLTIESGVEEAWCVYGAMKKAVEIENPHSMAL